MSTASMASPVLLVLSQCPSVLQTRKATQQPALSTPELCSFLLPLPPKPAPLAPQGLCSTWAPTHPTALFPKTQQQGWPAASSGRLGHPIGPGQTAAGATCRDHGCVTQRGYQRAEAPLARNSLQVQTPSPFTDAETGLGRPSSSPLDPTVRAERPHLALPLQAGVKVCRWERWTKGPICSPG